jgi:arsenite-transporting ATPase
MAQIITFLGKGGTGKTTLAIAAAKKLARSGQRVLLLTQDTSPAFPLLLEVLATALSGDTPAETEPNLAVLQLRIAVLLSKSWEEAKKLEAKYLRSPILKNVYGEELGIFPGMDNALVLNALREYEQSSKYDVIIFDGTGDQATLRMFAMPENLSWYLRRFRQVFIDSDLGKTVSPFIQPVTSAVLNVTWSSDNFAQEPTNEANQLLEQGKKAISNPQRCVAYLVTQGDIGSIATAQYLWGAAQQVGLTVAGVFLNQAQQYLTDEFMPLPLVNLPPRGVDWESLIQSLPDLTQGSLATNAPRPIAIDVAQRQVSLYLPNFDKKQVKLTQSGPEVTIEAGDQRRNLQLPPQMSGQPVKTAKFQDNYLIISF